MSPFEALMLVCFGAAWPASIWRSYVSRSTGGKSIVFLVIVALGYVSGVLHKMFFHFDPIIAFYAVNLLMVLADIALYMRNRAIERRAVAAV
jgi:hypothetical protein